MRRLLRRPRWARPIEGEPDRTPGVFGISGDLAQQRRDERWGDRGPDGRRGPRIRVRRRGPVWLLPVVAASIALVVAGLSCAIPALPPASDARDGGAPSAANGAGTMPSSAAAGRAARSSSPPVAVDAAAQRATLRQALALVGYEGRLGHRIAVAPPRPGVRAETNAGTRTITLFLHPPDAPHRVAHDLAHELGHAWDARHLDDAARRAYLRARGVPDAAWYPAPETPDYATGAGDFAEVFARCHAASPEFRSELAPAPADACAALPAAAREAG